MPAAVWLNVALKVFDEVIQIFLNFDSR